MCLMKDWKEFEKELLKDPAVRAEVEKLEPEYQLARQLIRARINQSMTQAEVAERAGVKQSYVARLESGVGNPTVSSLQKVAQALGLHIQLTTNGQG